MVMAKKKTSGYLKQMSMVKTTIFINPLLNQLKPTITSYKGHDQKAMFAFFIISL